MSARCARTAAQKRAASVARAQLPAPHACVGVSQASRRFDLTDACRCLCKTLDYVHAGCVRTLWHVHFRLLVTHAHARAHTRTQACTRSLSRSLPPQQENFDVHNEEPTLPAGCVIAAAAAGALLCERGFCPVLSADNTGQASALQLSLKRAWGFRGLLLGRCTAVLVRHASDPVPP